MAEVQTAVPVLHVTVLAILFVQIVPAIQMEAALVLPVVHLALIIAVVLPITLEDVLAHHVVQAVEQVVTKLVQRIVLIVVAMVAHLIVGKVVLLLVKQDVDVSVIGLAEAHAISNVRVAV